MEWIGLTGQGSAGTAQTPKRKKTWKTMARNYDVSILVASAKLQIHWA